MARYTLPLIDDGWPCISEGENRMCPAESDYDEDPGPLYEADLERWPSADSVNINWEIETDILILIHYISNKDYKKLLLMLPYQR